MDLDNITDIEVLKSALKKYMFQMKKDAHSNDGTDYLFKEGLWYYVTQDETGVTIYSDNMEHDCIFDYDTAKRYLNVG